MEQVVKEVVEHFLKSWFSPKEEEWLTAFKSGKKRADYRWGILWVSRTSPKLSGFWAWKAWLMNVVILGGILFLFRTR